MRLPVSACEVNSRKAGADLCALQEACDLGSIFIFVAHAWTSLNFLLRGQMFRCSMLIFPQYFPAYCCAPHVLLLVDLNCGRDRNFPMFLVVCSGLQY